MKNLFFTAGYVPSIADEAITWHTLVYEAKDKRLEVKVPVLTPAQILTVAKTIRTAAKSTIKKLSVSDIVRAIDLAVLQLLDVNHPDRNALTLYCPP